MVRLLGHLPPLSAPRLASAHDFNIIIAGSNLLADLLLTPIIMLGLKIAPKRGIRPLGKLMWWATGMSKPPSKVIFKLEAVGQLNGKPVCQEARVEHEDGYELTAIPVVALLKQYEEVRKPGLHMLGHLADPVHLFLDMEQMGVRVKTSFR